MEAFCTERIVHVKAQRREKIKHFLETISNWVFLEYKMCIMGGSKNGGGKDKSELINQESPWGPTTPPKAI